MNALNETLDCSEAECMADLLPELANFPWAAPLCDLIEQRGGITADNRPLLFEARVALALARANVDHPEYEHAAGVGDTTVDFKFGQQPTWLLEVVSIGTSDAVRAATVDFDEPLNADDQEDADFRWTGQRLVLSSPNADQSMDENIQSEEGESLLVVQKIGEKVHGRNGPVKFPVPQPDQFHAVVVDMRGHLDGGDIHDWKQIAYGGWAVSHWWRKFWVGKDGKRMDFCGVWDKKNPMRFAPTARERLHAIVFVAESEYSEGSLLKNYFIAPNQGLFESNKEWKEALDSFPLKK